jgi:hypothetical protein
MADKEWGLCKNCKWWQIEPNAEAKDRTMGVCIEEQLHSFRLRVSGNSGCNVFMSGEPAHHDGSSAKPPTTVQTR